MRIFLIGFMGCGKTTIGKQLAERLGLQFIDMDDYIVENQGRTINKIFEEDGEETFRQIERNAVLDMCSKENIVVGTGGGAPCFFDNMEQMNTHGQTFYLKLDTQGLVNRLQNATAERPLVKGKSKAELETYISNKLKERASFYSQAQHTIEALQMKVDDFLPFFE
jgi:shikimate kinase